MDKCYCCKGPKSEHSQICSYCKRTCLCQRQSLPEYVCVPECSVCETTEGNILPNATCPSKYHCDSCWTKKHSKSES